MGPGSGPLHYPFLAPRQRSVLNQPNPIQSIHTQLLRFRVTTVELLWGPPWISFLLFLFWHDSENVNSLCFPNFWLFSFSLLNFAVPTLITDEQIYVAEIQESYSWCQFLLILFPKLVPFHLYFPLTLWKKITPTSILGSCSLLALPPMNVGINVSSS